MNNQADTAVNPLLLADIVLSEDVLTAIQRKLFAATGNRVPLSQLRQDLLQSVLKNSEVLED